MSIRFKLVFAISAILIVVLSVTSLVLINSTQQRIKSDLIYRDQLIAERIVPTISQDLGTFYVYQFDAFIAHMKALIVQYPDLVGFRVIAPSGAVLADSTEIMNGRYSGQQRLVNDVAVAKIVSEGTYYQDEALDTLSGTGKTIVRVYAPYIDNFGTYRLMGEFHFSLTPIDEATRQSMLLFLLVASVGLLAGIVAAIIIANQMTKPIIQLTEYASDIREGHMNTDIEVNSRDEVGTLAKVFREMTQALKRSNEGLSEKVKELEQMNSLMVGRELKMSELKQQVDVLEQKKDNIPTQGI